ncbi:MAG: hypothetical protein LBT25_06700 [Candidatus Symbiothrix sp.]|jgi:hypothetical protein|nr:hypothetical protein [Candidatus Symbiothrix sp.]
MKKLLLSVSLFILAIGFIQAEKTAYFFDASVKFDPKIPTPEQFLGYELGTHITEHHQINAYLEKLATLSDKATLIQIGRTHELRPLKILIVSSPENLRNLDTFKEEREKVRKGETPNTPLIIFLGYTVHGNEVSGSEASLLSAYYLVAAQGETVSKQLSDGIYFIDPVRNPDGQERFAGWVNSNASVNYTNISSLDREHNEGWPRGRGNHYWFDLNRDWINIVHPESQARVEFYQSWLPHVQIDEHEMGTSSTFFFEPTDPNGNESRFVPKATYALNKEFGNYYAKALDKIGSFYYSKQEYDNKNPNFGSTYPDYNGAVGILFEQGSSRGIHQESSNGIITFAFTVRNQLVSAIATLDAANDNRKALFDLQKEFFTLTGKSDNSSYIFGDEYDRSRVTKFVKLLLAHHLDVYENNQDQTINGVNYAKGKSYIIPIAQPNSALVQIIFDDKKDYTDASKLGYGAGFSVAYSTGLAYAKIVGTAHGNKVEAVTQSRDAFQQSSYAYLIDYRDSRSQQLLLRLLEKHILVKSTFEPFSATTSDGVKEFTYGTLLIPVGNQTISSNELYAILKNLSSEESVEVVPVSTGYSVKGPDLGSASFRTITKPEVLVITGSDVSSGEAGELWHLFDIKLKYPVVRVESSSFRASSLKNFNRVVFVGGSYSFLDEATLQALKDWIRNGNTLITINSASQWAVNAKLLDASTAGFNRDSSGGNRRNNPDSTQVATVPQRGGGRVPTSVFETKIDLKSPIAFGLTNEILPVIRESAPSLQATGNVVARYSNSPLLNGYADEAALARFKTAASIRTSAYGSGSIILFGDNPLFRGIWDATERTFINAILLGNHLGGGGRFF